MTSSMDAMGQKLTSSIDAWGGRLVNAIALLEEAAFCPNGHILKKGLANYPFPCERCRKTVDKMDIIAGCDVCGYDICAKCNSGKAARKNTELSATIGFETEGKLWNVLKNLELDGKGRVCKKQIITKCCQDSDVALFLGLP